MYIFPIETWGFLPGQTSQIQTPRSSMSGALSNNLSVVHRCEVGLVSGEKFLDFPNSGNLTQGFPEKAREGDLE